MNKTWTKIALAIIALPILAMLLTACNSSTTIASCAFLVGDGQNGNDAKLQSVIYPGQPYDESHPGKNISFVPCNSRNYIVNDGSQRDANGQQVGDRHTLIAATTKDQTSITIAARALWTLNQSSKAMEDFYTVCFKYSCASDKDMGGSANYSTPGWNGMLGENMGAAMDAAGRAGAVQVNDDIWKYHDQNLYKTLGDAMSKAFADALRQQFGFPEDLFCGSGNSAWTDPKNPGNGEFTCSPVRIIVEGVEPNKDASAGTGGVIAINKQRLQNAQAVYGQNAGDWLALQDSINMCKAAGAPCVFNIGGVGSNAAVAIPANSPIPAVTPTPTK